MFVFIWEGFTLEFELTVEVDAKATVFFTVVGIRWFLLGVSGFCFSKAISLDSYLLLIFSILSPSSFSSKVIKLLLDFLFYPLIADL